MPSAYDLLNRKRRGEKLSAEEVPWLVEEFMRQDLADYQMAAFLMAVAIHGMSEDESVALTSALVHSGEQWRMSDESGFIADKHSTGGVGDKISLALAPWVAACGVNIGMLSGRGLGHTGGTLDKLETIPGFRARLTREELTAVIGKVGCAIATSTDRIAPADRRIYALRDVTGTVESLPLITASIMSKKLAFGASFLLLDVKTGSGAFMPTYAGAHELARALIGAARGSGMAVEAMITNMDRPLGRAIGNANEVLEAMAVLSGRGPGDVLALARAQAERILLASGRFGRDTAPTALDKALTSGKARETAASWIEAQGGDPAFLDDPALLGTPKHRLEIRAPRSGHVDTIDAFALGMIAIELGAGRKRQEDTIDPTAGIDVLATVGEPVRSGDPIAVLSWSRDGIPASELTQRYLDSVAITEAAPPAGTLIHEILTGDSDAA